MTEAKPPLIWLIDNNHWERAGIRALLMEHGCEVDGFVSIAHAVIGIYREVVERPALIVLEIKNLTFDDEEIDELFRWEAPVVLLTGVYENRGLRDRHKWAAVLRRPFSMWDVADLALRLLNPG